MVTGFSNNTKRYVSLFEEVIQEMMPERTIEVEADDVSPWLKLGNPTQAGDYPR